MTWSEAFTRELRFLDLAIGALVLLVLVTEGALLGASVYRAMVLQQGAQLEECAARHVIWLNPPPARHP